MTSSPWTPTSSTSSLPSHQVSPQHRIIHSQVQQPVQAQYAPHQLLNLHSPRNLPSLQTTQSTRASSAPEVITGQYAPSFEQDPRNQQASRLLQLREEPQTRVSQLLTSPGQSPCQPVPAHPNSPLCQATSRAQSVSSEQFHQQLKWDIFSQGTNPLNTSSLLHGTVPSNISITSSLSAVQPLTIRRNSVVSYSAAE
ncbi:hypothetical protein MMC29_002587 [Sticta canariensis]|nr:hypothetical protein [Sticta canariensis]